MPCELAAESRKTLGGDAGRRIMAPKAEPSQANYYHFSIAARENLVAALAWFFHASSYSSMSLLEKNNVIPLRKFSQYASRGTLRCFGGPRSAFMPTDNEPLADLYQLWRRSGEIDKTIGEAVTSHVTLDLSDRNVNWSALSVVVHDASYSDRALIAEIEAELIVVSNLPSDKAGLAALHFECASFVLFI